jgi:hypothetical protein
MTMLKRLLRAVDCGVTAFVNELFPLKVLLPLAEPSLDNSELIIVRKMIDDFIAWEREHAAAGETSQDGAAEQDATPAVPLQHAAAGVERLGIDADLLCSASNAVRAWASGMECTNPELFGVLAHDLARAAVASRPAVFHPAK